MFYKKYNKRDKVVKVVPINATLPVTTLPYIKEYDNTYTEQGATLAQNTSLVKVEDVVNLAAPDALKNALLDIINAGVTVIKHC